MPVSLLVSTRPPIIKSDVCGRLAHRFDGPFVGRLIGIAEQDAAALGDAIRRIEIGGERAIESVEAIGSRAGGVFRGRGPLPTSDLDLYVTVRSGVVNSAAKLVYIINEIEDVGSLFRAATGIAVNSIVEIDIVAASHKRQLWLTPFVEI